MRHPLFCIIIAVYNGQATLRRCLDSVIGQTSKDWELIVVDGGSTDGTVEILDEYRNYFSYWISEPDKGIFHAWNKALRQISGEWVIFLGADDRFAESTVLERITVNVRRSLPQFRVVYGRLDQVDRDGELIRTLGHPWSEVRKRLPVEMVIPHPATFHHRSLFSDLGGFDESFSIAGDYEFVLRELLASPAYFAEDVTVTMMQVGGVSASPRSSLKMLREMRKARRIHGIDTVGFYYPLSFSKVYLRIVLEKCLGENLSRLLLDIWRRYTGRKPYWTKV